MVNCIARMDLIIRMDGSSSLWYRSWRRMLWGTHCEQTLVDPSTKDASDVQAHAPETDEPKQELGKKIPKRVVRREPFFHADESDLLPDGDKEKFTAAIHGMK